MGAAIAFPLGMIVSGGEKGAEAPPSIRSERGRVERAGRDLYSPNVVTDPYVIEQQRRVVEALELNCRQFGKNCDEARLARRRVEEAAED